MASCGHEKAVQTGVSFTRLIPRPPASAAFGPGCTSGWLGLSRPVGGDRGGFRGLKSLPVGFAEDREGRWLVMWHGAGWLAGLNAETGELRWVRRVPSFTAAANMTVEISMTRCGAGRFRIGAHDV